MPETILLNQSQVKELTTMKEIIENVETAYKFHAERKVQMPPKNTYFIKNSGET